ncbi:MAG: hypothetical protein IJ327_03750 [Lachnospiraceae bacterium]|nr:hypothetical protein [Lachnospiraceae bacterium]
MELAIDLTLIFMAVMLLGAVVVIIGWSAEFINKHLKKARIFAKTKTVTLLHKKRIEVSDGLPDYVMVFRDEQYRQLELQADVIQYDAWQEGCYGKLVYQGKKCVSFDPAM